MTFDLFPAVLSVSCKCRVFSQNVKLQSQIRDGISEEGGVSFCLGTSWWGARSEEFTGSFTVLTWLHVQSATWSQNNKHSNKRWQQHSLSWELRTQVRNLPDIYWISSVPPDRYKYSEKDSFGLTDVTDQTWGERSLFIPAGRFKFWLTWKGFWCHLTNLICRTFFSKSLLVWLYFPASGHHEGVCSYPRSCSHLRWVRFSPSKLKMFVVKKWEPTLSSGSGQERQDFLKRRTVVWKLLKNPQTNREILVFIYFLPDLIHFLKTV